MTKSRELANTAEIKVLLESEPSIEDANVQEEFLVIFNQQSDNQLCVTIHKDSCYLYVDDEFDSSYDGYTTNCDFEVVMYRICQKKAAFDVAMQEINKFIMGGNN